MAQQQDKKENHHPDGLRTWIEISTDAIDHNMSVVKKLVPEKTAIMAVVKSNAYGHGLFEYSEYILAHGATWLGVDSIVEAVALREHGITAPILVLGYTLPEKLSEALEKDISITVSSENALQDVLNISSSKVMRVHIKIDTGLHRQGFLPEQVTGLVTTLESAREKIIVEGLYTHFADAKREEGNAYSKKQREAFSAACDQFKSAGFSPLVHANASPGLIRFGAEGDDLVRVGALLYGIWPSPTMKPEFKDKIHIKPALSWKTIVTEVKKLPKGSSVGYGQSEILAKDSIIAVCPVGYWHGYPSQLSSKGVVMIRGNEAKVVGKVTMDMITIDCTEVGDIKVGDVVTLIDMVPESIVNAEFVAIAAGISVHELVTRLNPRIKKIYSNKK